MDKSLIVKIVVIVIVALFLFEQFVPSMFASTKTVETGLSSPINGVTEFEATLKSYEPYVIATNLNAQQVAKFKSLPGVEEVILTDKGYVVSLKNSKFVKSVFAEMKIQNASMAVIANVYLPSNLELILENGSNVSIFTGASLVKVVMEPIVDEGSIIRLRMNGQAENGYLTEYSAPMIVASDILFASEAKVKDKLFDFYSFLIPWENRTEINATELAAKFGAENFSLTKKDYVLLETPLSVSEMLSKKYDYVSVITENSLTVVENFTNASRIISDFGNVTFPDTMLDLKASEDPKLNFNGTKNPVYSITLYGTDYVFSDPDVLIVLDKDYSINETLNVSVTASAVGNMIMTISDVKLSYT